MLKARTEKRNVPPAYAAKRSFAGILCFQVQPKTDAQGQRHLHLVQILKGCIEPILEMSVDLRV